VEISEESDGDDDGAGLDEGGLGADLGFAVELGHALAEAGLEVLGAAVGFAGVEFGVWFAGLFLLAEFCGAVVPVGDLFGESLVDGGAGLVDPAESLVADFLEVRWDDGGEGVVEGASFDVGREPGERVVREERFGVGLFGVEGSVVEVGGVFELVGSAVGVEFDEEVALADGASSAGGLLDAVDDGVLEGDEQAWGGAGVAFVDEDGAASEGVGVAFEGEVEGAGEQRVAGVRKVAGGAPLPVSRCFSKAMRS
jgi:hypothetical protein